MPQSPTITPLQPALSVAQVAEHWGVSVNTVYAMLNEGRLPYMRFGVSGKGSFRIRPEDVVAYEKSCVTIASQNPSLTGEKANTGMQYGGKTDEAKGRRVASATRRRL